MKVLLVYPEYKVIDPPISQPIGMLQLAAIADQYGHEVNVIDNSIFRFPLDVVRREIQKGWDVIAIGGFINQYSNIKTLIGLAQKECPKTVIVGGGPWCTALPFEVMGWNPDLDVCMLGECYETWRDVMQVVEKDSYFKKVKGVIYRDGQKVKLSGTRPPIPMGKWKDGTKAELWLDSIPYPAYDHAMNSLDTYFLYSQLPFCQESMGTQVRRVSMMTGYGDYNNYRQHSVEYVINLIKNLRMKYCINFVSFMDTCMMKDAEWFTYFIEQLQKNELATLIYWGMNADVRTADGPLLAAARDVGMRYVMWHDNYNSHRELDDNKPRIVAANTAAQRANINPLMHFTVGYPDTTWKDIIGDCQFLIDNQIHVYPQFYQPYPPSPEFDQLDLSLEAKMAWAESLVDPMQLSCNMTHFTDAELAGIRYLLGTDGLRLSNKTADLERLKIEASVDGEELK